MGTRSNRASSAPAFHAFTQSMWREYKIAVDYSTGLSEPTRANAHVPRGFVLDELGFGLDSPDKCGAGCRCTPLRSSRKRNSTDAPRTGRDWHRLAAGALAAARQAA